MKNELKQKITVVAIQIMIGFLHVIGVGRNSTEDLFILSASYFSDLALPFGFYFLLKLFEPQNEIFEKLWVKAGIIFLLASSAEMLQYLGVYALGYTFDPVDFLAYAAGVTLAICVDFIFKKILPFWMPVSGHQGNSEG